MAAFLRRLSMTLASNRVWRLMAQVPHFLGWHGLAAFLNVLSTRMVSNRPGRLMVGHPPWDGCLLKILWASHGLDPSFRHPPWDGCFLRGLSMRLASNRLGRLMARIPHFGHPPWDGCFLKRFFHEIGFKPPWASPGSDSFIQAPFLGWLLL